MVNRRYLGTSEIARVCQVTSVTVGNWIRSDKLKAVGANHVVIDDGEIHEQVRRHAPQGVHHALEVVGAATVKDTLKCVRHWGEVAVIGLLGWIVFQGPIRYYAWRLRKRLIWHTIDKLRGTRPWRGR